MDLIESVSYLEEIKHRFDGMGPRKKVDLKTFLNKFAPLMAKPGDTKGLTELFQKIDIDGEGEIDWDQFSDFVSTAKTAQQEDASTEKTTNDWRVVGATKVASMGAPLGTPVAGESNHADCVDKAIYLPPLDKFITCSRDGSWKIWNGGNLQHHRTVRYTSGDPGTGVLDRWVLDACYMTEWKKLAVLCHDSTITFYDINTTGGAGKNYERIVTIPFTEQPLGSPTCCTPARIHGDEYLLVGTSNGQVVVIRPNILEIGKLSSKKAASEAQAVGASPSKRNLAAKPSMMLRPSMIHAKMGVGTDGGDHAARLNRSHSLAAAVKLLRSMEEDEQKEKAEADRRKAGEKARAAGGFQASGLFRRSSVITSVQGEHRETVERKRKASLERGTSQEVLPPGPHGFPDIGSPATIPYPDPDDVPPTLPDPPPPNRRTSLSTVGSMGRRVSRVSSSTSVPVKKRTSIASIDLNMHSPLRRRFGIQYQGDCPPMEILYHEHKDWVTQILYEDETHQILTSSLDGKIVIYDTETLTVKSTYTQHHLGVKGMCYSPNLGIVASYGLEREIHLWLLRSGVKVGELVGLPGSVVSCAINDEMQHLYSVSVDNSVKVFDLKSQRLLQTLTEDMFERPEDRKVGFVHYDKRGQRLLTFYNRPLAWNLQCISHDALGHAAPITVTLYNSLFGSMITGDEEGTVVVWDCKTSRPINRFERTHEGKGGITAATLDATRRKLITAGSDHRVRVWNFNNGQLLKEFVQFEGPFHTTNVLHAVDEKRGITRVICTGWGGRAYAWEDKPKVSTMDEYKPLEGHREDILSLAFSKETHTVVTGDYEGRIILWSFLTMARHRSITHWLAGTPLSNAAECLVYLPPMRAYQQKIRLADALGAPDARNLMESEVDLTVIPSSRSNLVGFDASMNHSSATSFLPSTQQLPEAESTRSVARTVGLADLGESMTDSESRYSSFGASHFKGRESRFSDSTLEKELASTSYSRSAAILVSCMGDGRLLFWEMKNASSRAKAVVRAAHGRFDTISMVKVDPDLKFLVSGDSAGCIKVWDVRDIYKFFEDPRQETADECLRPLYHFITEPEVISALEIFTHGTGPDAQEFVAVSHGNTWAALYTIEGRFVGSLKEKSRFSVWDESTWAETHEQAAERRKRADEREARNEGDGDRIKATNIDSHKGGPLVRKNSFLGPVSWESDVGSPSSRGNANANGRTPIAVEARAPGSPSKAPPSPSKVVLPALPVQGASYAKSTSPYRGGHVIGQAAVLPANALQLLGLIRTEPNDEDDASDRGLRSEDSFVSKLSEAESELTALLGLDVKNLEQGSSISQAILNLKRVIRLNKGIPVFPGGEDNQLLVGAHDQAVGSHYQSDSIDPKGICLSTLHRALDCFAPEKVPESFRDIKNMIYSPSRAHERSAGRFFQAEGASGGQAAEVAAADVDGSPAKQFAFSKKGAGASAAAPSSAPERLELRLDQSLPPLPVPATNRFHKTKSGFRRDRAPRMSIQRGVVIDEDAIMDDGNAYGGTLATAKSIINAGGLRSRIQSNAPQAQAAILGGISRKGSLAMQTLQTAPSGGNMRLD